MKTTNYLTLLLALFISNVYGAGVYVAKNGIYLSNSGTSLAHRAAGMGKTPLPTTIAATATTPIDVIEKFEYPAGNLDSRNGGSGWSGPWNVIRAINVVAGDLSSPAAMPAGRAQFIHPNPFAVRDLASTYKDSIGKVYWISFYMRARKSVPVFSISGNNDSIGIDFGGIFLFNSTNDECGFMGKAGNFGVGFSNTVTMENSLSNANHYLVKIVMSGDNNRETAYMWRNYFSPTEPTNASANLTTLFGANGRLSSFSRIRLSGSGSFGSVPNMSIDDIRISQNFLVTPGTPIPVVSVALSPTTLTMPLGSSQRLTATINPANSSSTLMSWVSSSAAIATINGNTGIVTAVGVGTATITVTTADGNRTSTTTVTVTAATPAMTVTEKFEYTSGVLNSRNGGSGWAGPWVVTRGINVVVGNVLSTVASPEARARFVTPAPHATRNLTSTFTDAPGKVYWLSYSMRANKQAPVSGSDSILIEFCGIRLLNNDDFIGFIGKSGNNPDVGFSSVGSFIPNSLYSSNHYLVKIVMNGNTSPETAYMWKNYFNTTEPADASANTLTTNFGVPGELSSFNRVLLTALGSMGTLPDVSIDDIRISETFEPFILAIPVSSVTVNPPTATMTVGTTLQLSAFVAPTNATNRTVVWSSSDPTVATVSSTGLVTAVAASPTSINIIVSTNEGNFFALVALTVNSTVAVNSVLLSPATTSLFIDSTRQLVATINPANATNQMVTWSSSNPTVATVTSNGLVRGVAAGIAIITVTTNDGNKTAASNVTVGPTSTRGSSSSQNASLSVYPNPTTNGMLKVSSEKDGIKSITVISITGTRVLNLDVKAGNSTADVNVKSLPKGIYILEVTTTTSIIRKQVVIN